MLLTKSQEKAVIELLSQYLSKKREVIDFSAPTGSGKTFIATHLISRILDIHNKEKKKKTMFVVATVSNAELPRAFSKKLEEYKKYVPFKDFKVDFRESPSKTQGKYLEDLKGFEPEDNKIIVFGTSSFGKTRLFTELEFLEKFAFEVKDKDKWNIIYIRDEAHKGGASTTQTSEQFYNKRFDDKMLEISNFTIQMTATPKGNYDLVQLKEEDLLNDGVSLLKNKPIYNSFQRSTSNSDDLIRECLNKFKEIQEEYKNLPYFIRPALLIQVDSKSKTISKNDYNAMIDKIIKIISREYKLNYLKYFSSDIEGNVKEKLTLESASKHDSGYDVIVFKVGPATGWDIPRACMLLQIREVSSETLNIQTIGRIKRNPMKGLKENEITNKYYIYSNYQEGKRSLAAYKLKRDFHDFELYQGNLLLNSKSKKLIENKYYAKLVLFFKGSAIREIATENQSKTTLPIEERSFDNKKMTNNTYSIMASSVFKLKIWNDNEIRNNKKYFTCGLYKIIDKFSNDLLIHSEIIKYTILKECLKDIKSIYSESYSLYRKKEKYNLIPNQKLSKYYQMWISSEESNRLDVTNWEKYGYTLIRRISSNKQDDIQFLDSNPEAIFMECIKEELDHEDYYSRIKFFAKMPTLTSNIFLEYFNSKDNEKHRAFIDFALVANEKILMVEVKGWNDYDESKTKDLLYAFSKYKKQNLNLNIDLLICYSGKFHNNFKTPEIKFLKNGNLKGITIRAMMKDFFVNNI